ncbi:MAG: ArsR family transcriptional regulator [Thermoplasmatota archaeon]
MPARQPDHLLDLEARRRLFQLVQEYPGSHEREAARQLKMSQALVNFHRGVLEENGLTYVERGDGFVRMYARRAPVLPSPLERRIMAALRNRLNLQLMLVLLNLGRPAKHAELVEAAGLGKSKVSFYLRKLEKAGLAWKTTEGSFMVIDPRHVHQTLTRFRPTPDLVQEFSDLWSALYGL